MNRGDADDRSRFERLDRRREIGQAGMFVGISELVRREVRPAGEGYTWVWKRTNAELDDVLAPVVESAAALLTSPDLSRVRECESETCGWLFIDRSRNRSRRWCDMTVCGNRAKVRRHYQRTHAKP